MGSYHSFIQMAKKNTIILMTLAVLVVAISSSK